MVVAEPPGWSCRAKQFCISHVNMEMLKKDWLNRATSLIADLWLQISEAKIRKGRQSSA